MKSQINIMAWKYNKNKSSEDWQYNPEVKILNMDDEKNKSKYNPKVNARELMRFIFNSIPYNTNQVWSEKLANDIKSHLQNPESSKLILTDQYHLENIIRTSLNELTQMEVEK